MGRKNIITLLIALGLILPGAIFFRSCTEPVYDVVVVGGWPAGIGAALAAAREGATVALLERDGRIGGTTVQAEVVDMGLFYAWRKPIIAGPGWDMVVAAVASARRCDPREVPLDLVKERLRGIGHIVP